MTLDELTQKALAAYSPTPFNETRMRAAVLAVLAEVREMVPEKAPPNQFDKGISAEEGWNDSSDEMLRRLDAITGGE